MPGRLGFIGDRTPGTPNKLPASGSNMTTCDLGSEMKPKTLFHTAPQARPEIALVARAALNPKP